VEEELLVGRGIEHAFSLEAEDLLFLFGDQSAASLIFAEESVSCLDDRALVDAPDVAKLVQNILFLVHLQNGLLVSYIIKSDNTIRNPLCLD